MKKFSFLAFLSILMAGCNAKHQTSADKVDGTVSVIESVRSLVKVAPIIDHDTESFWAYGVADSMLASCDTTDYCTCYNSIAYVFYGMSYTRAIYRLTLPHIVHGDSTLSEPVRSELRAIDSYITFYEISTMWRAAIMRDCYDKYISLYHSVKDADGKYAVRYMQICNKKLFFKTFLGLLADLAAMQNDMDNLDKVSKAWADTLDDIDSESVSAIAKLSDEEFQSALDTGVSVESAMIRQLAAYIRRLKD